MQRTRSRSLFTGFMADNMVVIQSRSSVPWDHPSICLEKRPVACWLFEKQGLLTDWRATGILNPQSPVGVSLYIAYRCRYSQAPSDIDSQGGFSSSHFKREDRRMKIEFCSPQLELQSVKSLRQKPVFSRERKNKRAPRPSHVCPTAHPSLPCSQGSFSRSLDVSFLSVWHGLELEIESASLKISAIVILKLYISQSTTAGGLLNWTFFDLRRNSELLKLWVSNYNFANLKKRILCVDQGQWALKVLLGMKYLCL